ncbi:universal stress protein [Thiovibrio sp. JS02]
MNDIKKILVPTDFSRQTSKVLQSACMIARKFGAAIHVIFVVESLDAYAGFAVPHLPLADLEKDLFTRAEKKMDEFIDEYMEKNIQHIARVLTGPPSEKIVAYARQEGCDLIMIGTQSCRGVDKTLFGSVTDRVIKTATCPVLSINPCV